MWVRKTAKRFGLNTDSSFRFERGIDPNMQVYAAKRAALLQKHDGVQVHLLESIAAYFYALQGRPEQAPELFREHKLAEVSFFGPCRPMMSLIEQQVWLAQGDT